MEKPLFRVERGLLARSPAKTKGGGSGAKLQGGKTKFDG